MTGRDLIFWLDELWFDLIHFGQTGVLSLIFRLFVLFIAVVILWSIAKTLGKNISKVIGQIWQFLLIPVGMPKKFYRKIKRREENQKQQEEWRQLQKNQEKMAILQQKEDEKRRRKEKKAIEKALRLD